MAVTGLIKLQICRGINDPTVRFLGAANLTLSTSQDHIFRHIFHIIYTLSFVMSCFFAYESGIYNYFLCNMSHI